MLHYSIYNRMVKLPDGTQGVYNLITHQKLRLTGFIGAMYNSVLNAPDSKLAKKWKGLGFLTEGDEIVKLRLVHGAAQNNMRRFGLTICPTRGCNFRCPYCFEEHLAGGMSEEVREKLIAFVKNFIETNHPVAFSVTWFGGEPLLYPQIIEHLSAEFIKICEENKVEYSAGIITNGYFYNQKNVDMLEAAKVANCQITLDGPKEQNDKTRILADGRGSYDVIMGNLKVIKTKMRISVRCNTNTENRASYDELASIIKALQEETGNDISSYPAYMDSAITADKSKLDKQSLDYDGYLEKERTSMLNDLKSISFKPCYCTTQYASSFVVRDDGTLCKCWNDVTIKEKTVASLLDKSNPIFAQLNTEWGLKYLGLDVFADEECRTCQLLPICGGGCPAKRLSGQKECFKKLEPKLDELIIKSFAEDKNKQEEQKKAEGEEEVKAEEQK